MFTIATAAPDEWTAALERALAQTPEAARPARIAHCRDLLANGVLDPRGLWVARADGAIIAAQVCVALPGSACLFWLPASKGNVADALVRAVLDWCRGWHCKIAQALASDAELLLAEPLLRHGFRQVTRLCQLERQLHDLPDTIDSRLRFEAYRPSIAADFAVTLERTYEGTLDCPELNGRRSMDEIIAGHRGQGRFDPQFWWLAFAGNQPAGVVLLDEMPDAVTWELAYLGIVPPFRRHGFGRAMALHALRALCDHATRLTLVVDERNLPARRLYESLGFQAIDTSNVLLFFL
jgi:mycothiol synthase